SSPAARSRPTPFRSRRPPPRRKADPGRSSRTRVTYGPCPRRCQRRRSGVNLPHRTHRHLETAMKPRVTRSLLALALVAAMAGCSPTAANDAAQAAGTSQAADDKAAQLDQLYTQYWEEMLELHPLAATFQGDPRYNDRLPNFLSAEYRQESHDFTTRWLEKIEGVG